MRPLHPSTLEPASQFLSSNSMTSNASTLGTLSTISNQKQQTSPITGDGTSSHRSDNLKSVFFRVGKRAVDSKENMQSQYKNNTISLGSSGGSGSISPKLPVSKLRQQQVLASQLYQKLLRKVTTLQSQSQHLNTTQQSQNEQKLNDLQNRIKQVKEDNHRIKYDVWELRNEIIVVEEQIGEELRELEELGDWMREQDEEEDGEGGHGEGDRWEGWQEENYEGNGHGYREDQSNQYSGSLLDDQQLPNQQKKPHQHPHQQHQNQIIQYTTKSRQFPQSLQDQLQNNPYDYSYHPNQEQEEEQEDQQEQEEYQQGQEEDIQKLQSELTGYDRQCVRVLVGSDV